MKKWGKKIYMVAADYNYGQITTDWVKKYCARTTAARSSPPSSSRST